MSWSSSSLHPAPALILPITGSIQPDVKVTNVTVVKTAHNHSQVGGKQEQKHQAPTTLSILSRRGMASHLAVASLIGATAFLPEPAEARMSNSEIKKKIFEKLRMLREKAGLSEPKTDKEKTTPPLPSEKEKEAPLPQLPISPLPVQNT